MQGITGINEKVRLKMTISIQAFCANSVNYCTFKNHEDIYYFLGIFNSKLLNYIFKQFSTNSNVNGYEIDNLPIIIAEDKNIISNLTKKVLKAKEDGQNTLNDESAIDFQVYKLYGLTYVEVCIVDPETPITREEYEDREKNSYISH